MTLSTFS
jgi:hypothetical protein